MRLPPAGREIDRFVVPDRVPRSDSAWHEGRIKSTWLVSVWVGPGADAEIRPSVEPFVSLSTVRVPVEGRDRDIGLLVADRTDAGHRVYSRADVERRRLLLDRLRDMLEALEHSSRPSVDELIETVEATTVVDATIEDVVTRDRWDAAWELQEP